jgi:ribonuclease HI
VLNHKYFISAFSTGGDPLRRLLAVLSRLNSTKMIQEFDSSSIFFTNGSKGGRVPVLVYIILVVPSLGLREPCGVFTLDMSAIFVALIQIRTRFPGRYLIVTDSMSFLKALQTLQVASRTPSLEYKIKEACWWPLKNNMYEIHMMWIPSRVGVRGNERADRLAGDVVENGMEWHAPVQPSEFLLFVKG